MRQYEELIFAVETGRNAGIVEREGRDAIRDADHPAAFGAVSEIQSGGGERGGHRKGAFAGEHIEDTVAYAEIAGQRLHVHTGSHYKAGAVADGLVISHLQRYLVDGGIELDGRSRGAVAHCDLIIAHQQHKPALQLEALAQLKRGHAAKLYAYIGADGVSESIIHRLIAAHPKQTAGKDGAGLQAEIDGLFFIGGSALRRSTTGSEQE